MKQTSTFNFYLDECLWGRSDEGVERMLFFDRSLLLFCCLMSFPNVKWRKMRDAVRSICRSSSVLQIILGLQENSISLFVLFYMRWQIDQLWYLMMIREVGKYCVCVCENLNLKRLFVCFWMLLCVNQREINSSKLLYWMSYLRYEITWVVVTFKYLFHFWKERKKIWNQLECFILLLRFK